MSEENFKSLLNSQYVWPAKYIFKFIVKKEELDTLLAFFPPGFATTRPSAKGKYISVTLEMEMNSADAVLAVYEKVSVVPGLIKI